MPRLPHAHMSTSVLLALGFCASCLGASARAEQGPMEAWANWVLAPKVWKGQTVSMPDPTPRPTGPALRLDSWRLPLHVHAPLGTSYRRLQLALAALEQASDAWTATGFPLPFADGGYGGTAGFDLYLEANARAAASAEVDVAQVVSDFDAAQTYAVVDAAVATNALPACVQSAFAQAALRGQDPSEAQSWLGASGDLAAWLLDGELGCDESLVRAEREAKGGMLDARTASGAAGGLLLAVLSEQHDGSAGSFVQALWELTRQRSRELVDPGVLRASPDLWEVLAQTLKVSARQDWSDALEDFAAARFFAGPAVRRAAAPYHVLHALPSDAAVPLLAELSLRDLPRHVRDEVECLGSAYLSVRTPGAQAGDTLQVWLRGEIGPRWSLIAMRLAEDGHELGRVKVPGRRLPQSYLPVMLTEDTAQVIVVVTYLPEKVPDADVPPLLPHGFELIIDHAPNAAP